MDGDGRTGGACLLNGVTSVSHLPSLLPQIFLFLISPNFQAIISQPTPHLTRTLLALPFRALRRVGLVSWYWGKGGVKLAWLKFNAGGVEMEIGIYISPIILTAEIKDDTGRWMELQLLPDSIDDNQVLLRCTKIIVSSKAKKTCWHQKTLIYHYSNDELTWIFVIILVSCCRYRIWDDNSVFHRVYLLQHDHRMDHLLCVCVNDVRVAMGTVSPCLEHGQLVCFPLYDELSASLVIDRINT